MKKKIFAVALVVALLVGGLIMSCGRIACPGLGTCEVELTSTGPKNLATCENKGCAVNNQEEKTGTLECDC